MTETDKKQEAFLRELLNDFKIEAAEHHQAITMGLLEMEKNLFAPELKPLIESTFREIHSLKGAARAVNQLEIERLCQSMEGVFHQAKQGSLTFVKPMFEILYQVVDLLGVMLAEVETKGKSIGANVISQTMRRLEMIALSPVPDSVSPVVQTQSPPIEIPVTTGFLNPDKQPGKDTVRISTAKLETLLREAEEFISVKARLGYFISEVKKNKKKESTTLNKELEQFHFSMSRMVDDLLLDIKTTLLYPFSTLLDIVPKIVRDLGREYAKEINPVISGGEIEINRRILDEIKDPLIHLIRNSIDHGIETPAIRELAGKSPTGMIEVNIQQESVRNVIMTVRDDGAGINREKIIQSAIKAGFLNKESVEQLTDSEIYSLIFRSGLSTSPFITDISGRGIGMAIVAEKVSKLGGVIDISSVPGKGCTFSITLPVTISNFRGILVQAEEQFFIIPTTYVERAVRIYKKDIRTVEAQQIVILNGESIALAWLGTTLGIKQEKIKKNPGAPMPLLILSMGVTKIGFLVDQVHGEQEGIVKEMGPQLLHVTNISGVTILGNGQIIPILNIPALMNSAARVLQGDSVSESAGDNDLAGDEKKSILVAEDSITSRTLLRNIIESAGYRVKTAVDGKEAFLFLKNEMFDLVVSDVEMSEMNGFELTRKIRQDKTVSETPIILLTALDSAADRQNGMESGANAYIVKGNFEQSNLLETIHRLI